MLEKFTIETFSGRIGETFRISADHATALEAELIEALPGPTAAETTSGGRLPFSIVLRGPMEPVLPQRIYRFENESLGSFELFIVPVGPDDAGMQYEAVFA